jgi:hypothetical protein
MCKTDGQTSINTQNTIMERTHKSNKNAEIKLSKTPSPYTHYFAKMFWSADYQNLEEMN